MSNSRGWDLPTGYALLLWTVLGVGQIAARHVPAEVNAVDGVRRSASIEAPIDHDPVPRGDHDPAALEGMRGVVGGRRHGAGPWFSVEDACRVIVAGSSRLGPLQLYVPVGEVLSGPGGGHKTGALQEEGKAADVLDPRPHVNVGRTRGNREAAEARVMLGARRYRVQPIEQNRRARKACSRQPRCSGG